MEPENGQKEENPCGWLVSRIDQSSAPPELHMMEWIVRGNSPFFEEKLVLVGEFSHVFSY